MSRRQIYSVGKKSSTAAAQQQKHQQQQQQQRSPLAFLCNGVQLGSLGVQRWCCAGVCCRFGKSASARNGSFKKSNSCSSTATKAAAWQQQQQSPLAFQCNGVQLGPLGAVQRWCCAVVCCLLVYDLCWLGGRRTLQEIGFSQLERGPYF